jgi:tellurite resistance protein
MQAELVLTERALEVLDGWPGAAPEDLVENLLAVLVAEAKDETDPARKRKLETLIDSVREVGVAITSEVLAKVLTGG